MNLLKDYRIAQKLLATVSYPIRAKLVPGDYVYFCRAQNRMYLGIDPVVCTLLDDTVIENIESAGG
jgi:hypothetical protein